MVAHIFSHEYGVAVDVCHDIIFDDTQRLGHEECEPDVVHDEDCFIKREHERHAYGVTLGFAFVFAEPVENAIEQCERQCIAVTIVFAYDFLDVFLEQQCDVVYEPLPVCLDVVNEQHVLQFDDIVYSIA